MVYEMSQSASDRGTIKWTKKQAVRKMQKENRSVK